MVTTRPFPEDDDAFHRLMDNIVRLVEDADFLKQAARYPSAYVLATIALEEVGKLIHQHWNHLSGDLPKDKYRSEHLRKQWAVGCTVVAQDMLTLLPATQGMTGAEIFPLIQSLMNERSFKLMASIMEKRVDNGKKLGLYQDESGPTAQLNRDMLDWEAVQFLIDQAVTALGLLHNRPIAHMAREIYQKMPALIERFNQGNATPASA